MKYDTFLLDVDDTIFDFSACAKNALYLALAACGIEGKEDYHARYLAINDLLWGKLERGEITHDALVEERFRLFLKEIGREDVAASKLNAKYIERLSLQTATFEGAEDFLKKLNGLGRVYIVTNGTASVQRKRFALFKMERFCKDVFISEDVGHYKPSKEYFKYVAEHIPRFERKKTLLIGDSLTSDILLAQGAGVDCVWFNPSKKPFRGEQPPTYEADGYEKILEFATHD